MNVAAGAQVKIDLLAKGITDRLAHAVRGHCARVDYLTEGEARLVCEQVQASVQIPDLTARVLAHRHVGADSVFIGADKAIELRNRKETVLCLFVPVDLVDAAFSSLANAFEVIDGRELYRAALERLLGDLDHDVAQNVRSALSRVRVSPRATDTQRLEFAVAVSERADAGDLDHAGLELYRIGLIADGGADFVARLEKNRRSALSLSRPTKLQASPSERIRDAGVDQATGVLLLEFFRMRAMNDVASWSRELSAHPDLTLDKWVFPKEDQSDLLEVRVKPFMGEKGAVERYCKLKQVGGALQAECGPKGTLVVRWETDPKEPRNLSRWRVEIVPAGGSADDVPDELPGREVPAARREATLKLDIEPEEAIDYAVRVRITPLDSGKHEIVDGDTGVNLAAESQEFYLVTTGETPVEVEARQTGKTVPSIGFGRMEYLLSSREIAIEEAQPQWTSKDLEYFSLKLNGRRELHVAASPVLLALERQILKDPRGASSFVVRADELAPLTLEAVKAVERSEAGDRGGIEAWQTFWNARATFFGRLTNRAPRDVLEAADWSTDLADSAIRYAQMYTRLLEELTRSGASRDELVTALAVDSLLVTLDDGAGVEEALVTLPTHPMRAAWLASFGRLLRAWEDRLRESGSRPRHRACDLELLQLVSPVNVPGFGVHPASSLAFVFFQNLLFFNGVALPAAVGDPQRRFDDLAMILGVDTNRTTGDGVSPDRLGGHVERFLQTHPYITRLMVNLLNPDRGELVAEAMARLFERITAEGEEKADAEKATLPSVEVTAYVERPERGAGQAFDRMRQAQMEQRLAGKSDALHPALSVAVRDMKELSRTPPADAHLAVISDLTRPQVRLAEAIVGQEAVTQAPSFALYGLVARMVPMLNADLAGIVWRYVMTPGTGGKGEQHPGGPPRYTDVLVETHAAQLAACAVTLGGAATDVPALEVRLGSEQSQLLARLHEGANWVISLDRHFALEYYDSPRAPELAELAQTYVLDYAPDFTEGLGHRMLVTTTWREEITILLRDAMEELGLRAVDNSVRQVLQTLKTVSGHLAVQVLASPNMATAAAGLAIVTAWLKAQRRLEQAILIPVDLHPSLFTPSGTTTSRGERRCDLMLIGFRRNKMEVTCIEVKWRRGNAPLDDLAPEMLAQMEGTAQALAARCFDPERVDGSLQRAHLANVLRFYFERARRYGLFDPAAESTFVEHLARLEKSGIELHLGYEGFVVNLDGEPRKPLQIPNGRVIVLTAESLEILEDFREGDSPEGDGPDGNGLTRGSRSSGIHEVTVAPASVMPTPVEDEDTADEDAGNIATPQMRSGVAESQEVRVALGEAQGEVVEWVPSVKGSPHLFVTGIPGQGKSWTILRLLGELGRHGVPSLVFDFHGQFTDGASPYMENPRPVILDAAEGLPFSPFELSADGGESSWKAATYELAEIFGYVAGLGEIQQDAMRQAIRAAYVRYGYDEPIDARSEGRERTPPTLTDVLRQLERLEATRRTANVLARCRPLLEMDLFRPVAGAPNLISLARQGLVIDLHGLYAESLQLAAGAFVLRKVYRDMFRWGQAEGLRLAVVLDEAHRLARDVTLPKIMKEGRKFGICAVVASQGMGDFHPEVLATAGTKVIFRTNYPDSRKVAGFIRSRPGAELASRIEQLSVGMAYVQTPQMPYGALVRMYPPETEQPPKND